MWRDKVKYILFLFIKTKIYVILLYMDIISTDRLIITNKNNIKLKNIREKDKYNIKINNINLINKAFNLFNNAIYAYIINSPSIWMGISYTTSLMDVPKYFNELNIKIKDNIITFYDKYKYLLINDNFANNNLYIKGKKITFDEYLKYTNKKNINITIVKHNLEKTKKSNFTNISKSINGNVKYKLKYITYDTVNKKKILPSVIYSNINKLNDIKENINFDIGFFFYKKQYLYNKNKKYIYYFNNLNKVFYSSMKYINKNGCLQLTSIAFLHNNYYNFICYILNYFEKIILISHNTSNIQYLSSYPAIEIIAINYNGKKIRKFNSKYNYNDSNSIKIKKEVYNYFLIMINKFINEYLNSEYLNNEYLNNEKIKNIKNFKDIDPIKMFLNNINNIKLYCLKYNIKTNLLLNEYFKQYDNNLLFDLNYFIKICIQNNILNIYYLENTEYTEYLVDIMKPQYEKDFKYLKYEKNTKIMKNSLLYLNTNKTFDINILLNFDNILIKKECANFFDNFYIKDENENYYFLNKNEFSVSNLKNIN
jgi:hypothetical protein